MLGTARELPRTPLARHEKPPTSHTHTFPSSPLTLTPGRQEAPGEQHVQQVSETGREAAWHLVPFYNITVTCMGFILPLGDSRGIYKLKMLEIIQ